MALFAVTALFGLFMLWAAVAEVEEIVSAPGVVRPGSNVRIVNHPVNGRVSSLLVSEGDRMAKGQLLMTPDPGSKDVGKRREKWRVLAVTASRLKDEALGKSNARRATVDIVIRRKRVQLSRALQALRESMHNLKEIADHEKEARKLVKKGLYPELKYLAIRRLYDDAYGKAVQARQAVAAAEAALAAAQKQ